MENWSEGREGMGDRRNDALVVCGEKSMNAGITIWDLSNGDRLLHIPTCASSKHGFICMRNRFLVASQVHKHGSVGGGSIFMWPLNKPHTVIQSCPMEAIGPICITKDAIFLAAGAPTGNTYVWEVTSGRLLKNWRSHCKSVACLHFSDDDSLLISGSDDGIICIWSMLCLLDAADLGCYPSLLNSSSHHLSSITGLISTSGSSRSLLISSSLDATCKVWDLLTGRLLQTKAFPNSIAAIVMDPGEQLLFSGDANGIIFVNKLDIGLAGDPYFVLKNESFELNEHKGAISALAFSELGLLSASEDCTACLWDVGTWKVIRRFNHQKGPITNMVLIPQSSLRSSKNRQKNSNQFCVSTLEKIVQSNMETVSCRLNGHGTAIGFPSSQTQTHEIHDFEPGHTRSSMVQMEVETSIENRLWATKMAKHVMEMNRHLQSRLLDLMQARLLRHPDNDSTKCKKRNKSDMRTEKMKQAVRFHSKG